MSSNPKWVRDELILALDLYFRVNPVKTTKSNPEIVELSKTLNRLPIHVKREGQNSFRNPNSVYMKMCNFLRLDPEYDGKGLAAGSKLDEEVWNEFSGDKLRLQKTAKVMLNNYELLGNTPIDAEASEEMQEFPEGKIVYKIHKSRERNKSLVNKKKQRVLEEKGSLVCEACCFDFEINYGVVGKGFIECHHTIPVSELNEKSKTSYNDLVLVCSNCHRMLHSIRPWLQIEELKMLLKSNGFKDRSI